MLMNHYSPLQRWSIKFRHAIRGIRVGVHKQSSFPVHLVAAALVTIAAVLLRVNTAEWCLLLLCIVVVLGAELFNSALERLAQAISQDYDEAIRDALDIASGAVLLVAVGAALVGTIIFVLRLGILFDWWGSYLII